MISTDPRKRDHSLDQATPACRSRRRERHHVTASGCRTPVTRIRSPLQRRLHGRTRRSGERRASRTARSRAQRARAARRTAAAGARSDERQRDEARRLHGTPPCRRGRREHTGIERFQIVRALSHADAHHGEPEFPRDGHYDAAFRRPVELGEDDGVERQRPIELARLNQAVLSRGGIHDEHGANRERALTLGNALDLHQLGHQVRRGVQAAGGIDEDHVGLPLAPFRDSIEHDRRRVRPVRPLDHRHIRALGPDAQLLDGGGTERVAPSR